MRGPPVVLTNTLGRPVTNVISERGAVPMTVVNTLGEPVTLVASGGEPVTLFNANGTLWDYPFSLFANNEQGAWYDPSDFSTLFQNSTGTTPVTAVEQPVRLMLDRSGRGNHALAPNDASRPVLRARYNQLTYSEQFDNAAWDKVQLGSAVVPTVTANQGVAPDGTTTADRVQFSLNGATASGDLSLLRQFNATTGALTHSVWVKSFDGSSSYAMQIIDSVGNPNAITVTGSWQRFTVTATSSTNVGYGIRLRGAQSPTNSNTADVLIWGAQLLSAADQSATGGAYQRIAAATDYDTSNPVWRPYLAFDGSDDSFSTSAIDFSGTDEITVFAGVTKLSDAGRATVVELGTGGVATETFFINAPRNAATDNIGFASAGSSVHEATASGVAAPITRVVTGIGDISGDVATLRLNGVQAATNTGNQGTGNYANAALFIGRRNNMFDPLNGRLYSLAVLGRTATAAELGAMEAWVNGKTGAY